MILICGEQKNTKSGRRSGRGKGKGGNVEARGRQEDAWRKDGKGEGEKIEINAIKIAIGYFSAMWPVLWPRP